MRRSGAPCAKYPLASKHRCRLHGGLSTGPKTVTGRAAISAANTKHGRYKNWREKQAKERYYRDEIKRVMEEAREVGLLPNKRSVRDPRALSNLFRVPSGLSNPKLRKLKSRNACTLAKVAMLTFNEDISGGSQPFNRRTLDK